MISFKDKSKKTAKKTTSPKIDVPFYSHLDASDPIWQDRARSVACLAMLIEYYRPHGIKSLDGLILEGVAIDAFTSAGWSHPRLVVLAHNYGIRGYMEEFRSKNEQYHEAFFDKGVEKIADHLDHGHPVMASTYRNWTDEQHFNLVVLTGYLKDDSGILGFYYNDPDAKSAEEGKNKFVDFKTFKSQWRRLVIFMGW
ncbi:MAG: C39 family peptidase [Patescibacteria group bacterium]